MVPDSESLEYATQSNSLGVVYITHLTDTGTGSNVIEPVKKEKTLMKPNRHQRRAQNKSNNCPLCGKE